MRRWITLLAVLMLPAIFGLVNSEPFSEHVARYSSGIQSRVSTWPPAWT